MDEFRQQLEEAKQQTVWQKEVWLPCKLSAHDNPPLCVLEVAFPTYEACGRWIGQTPPYNNGKWRPMEMDTLPDYVKSQKGRVLQEEIDKAAYRIVSQKSKNEIRKSFGL